MSKIYTIYVEIVNKNKMKQLYITNTSHTQKGVKLSVYNGFGTKNHYAADSCAAQASKGALR